MPINEGRVEYIYECGCRTDQWTGISPNGQGRIKGCPIHKARLKAKVRWCSICGTEWETSPMSNQKKFICPDCRPGNKSRLTMELLRRNKKLGVEPMGFRASTGRTWDNEKNEWIDPVTKILDAKFPLPAMPSLSAAAGRVLRTAGVL